MTTRHNADDKSDDATVQRQPVCQMKRGPVAPAVYRPQPMPRVLQRKLVPNEQGTTVSKWPKPPVAPAPTNKRPQNSALPRPSRHVAQSKSIAKIVPLSLTKHQLTGRSPAVIQRAEERKGIKRPRRDSVNYDQSYEPDAESDMEKLDAFATSARASIAKLRGSVTVEPHRNLPAAGARGEDTFAYLRTKSNGASVALGSSGANQHGEMRCLDGLPWKATSRGTLYYFVCDGGKPCCYLCTAIASLLKITVAGTDGSVYPEYSAPNCLKTNDQLWKEFVGDEAHAVWAAFPEGRQAKLRSNLGWVHKLGVYWFL